MHPARSPPLVVTPHPPSAYQPPAPPACLLCPLPRAPAHTHSYTKFLIGRDGQTVKRYKPSLDPLDFEGDVGATRPQLC